MNSARAYLAQIAHSAESQYPSTRLATNHAYVTRKVRRHRTARAAATTVAGVGVVGGGGWGALMAFGSSNDEGVPGATESVSPIPTPPTDAQTLSFSVVSFTAGETLDAWVTDTAFVLGVDKQALLDAIAAAAPGDSDPEGWIKPGSYTVGPSESVEEIARSLVAQLVSQLETLGVPRDQWQAVITKASLVQAETPLESDMPKTARVIQNRVDLGLFLQLDSTVKYVVGDNGGPFVNPDDRKVDSPYNTYLNPGLPPGAIGSPSDAAIDAVVNPAEGDWLYVAIVNLETGEARFATTYEEHLANVDQLSAWIDAQAK